jgi:hypothetical protein
VIPIDKSKIPVLHIGILLNISMIQTTLRKENLLKASFGYQVDKCGWFSGTFGSGIKNPTKL